MEVTINLQTLFWFVAGIGTLITVGTAVYKMLPSTKLEQRVEPLEIRVKELNEAVDELESKVTKLDEYVNKDNLRLKKVEEQLLDVHKTIAELLKRNDEQIYLLTKGVQNMTKLTIVIADTLSIENSEIKKYDNELNEYLLK